MNAQLLCGYLVFCLLLHVFSSFPSGGLPPGHHRRDTEKLPTNFSVASERQNDQSPSTDSNLTADRRAGNEDNAVAVILTPSSAVLISTEVYANSKKNASDTTFSDVSPDSPFYDAIYWAVERGITNGTTPSTFSPDATCKRKHIIMFIWRGCGKPYDAEWIYPFEADEELNPDSEFARAATWAYRRYPTKLESGEAQYSQDGNGLLFLPEKDCDRGETVIYLWKLAGCPETEMEYAERFKDILTNLETSDPYFKELPKAVAWAVENGITKGTSEDMFSPRKTCTRGQIVTFLYRFSQTDAGKAALAPA